MKYVLLIVFLIAESLSAQTIFFKESFDDPDFLQRGWYDNATGIPTTMTEHHGASGMAAEFMYPKGGTKAKGGVRRQFAESNSVYLSYWVKYSANFVGSGKPYHPHEFHFTTNLNEKYVGPSWTKMTLYVEQNDGHPILSFQDSQNIDTSNIKNDISSSTEFRSCGGCNGSSDAYPAGDCYKSGANWFNGKTWKATIKAFADTGMYNKNEWHHVEAYFKLNSISNGKGIADGTAQYWFDGELLIDAQNVMFRTAANPTMMFNQFLMLPYIGDGSPVEQTMWVDDLMVGDSRPTPSGVEETVLGHINIYPNPVDGFLTVDLGGTEVIGDVFFIDILGNEVAKTLVSIQKNGFIISIKVIPRGVYILKFQTPLGVYMKKIHITH